MQFSLLYGQQLDIELGSADRTQLFTTARRQKAVNDAMHNWERITSCTPVLGTIPLIFGLGTLTPNGTAVASGNTGSGYAVNDILTLSGGTFTTAAQLKVTTINSSGVPTAFNTQTAGSYTVLPSNPVSVTGGSGSGLTVNPVWAGTAEYDLLSNFSTYISMQDRRMPAIKKVNSTTGTVTWAQGNNDMFGTSPTWLDDYSPGWEADPSGSSANWYIREDSGTTYLGFDPAPLAPSGYTWTAYVPYLSTSTDMSADTDLPFTVAGKSFARLAPYHQALVHYAAGLLEPLRKNYSAADRQMKLYAGYVAQYETDRRKKGPNKIRQRRNYYQDAHRNSRPLDPHRFP